MPWRGFSLSDTVQQEVMDRHSRLAAGISNYRFEPSNLSFTRDQTKQAIPFLTRNDFNSLNPRYKAQPSLIRQLNLKLAKNHPYDWNILVIEKIYSHHSDYREMVQQYCRDNNIQTQGHITFAFNSSTGDPITPWMVCHKIGHALLKDETCSDLMGKILLLAEQSGLTTDNTSYIYSKIFNFRSVRDRLTENVAEILRDALAQYLLTGKIASTPEISKELETKFSTMLQSAIGEILIDYY